MAISNNPEAQSSTIAAIVPPVYKRDLRRFTINLR